MRDSESIGAIESVLPEGRKQFDAAAGFAAVSNPVDAGLFGWVDGDRAGRPTADHRITLRGDRGTEDVAINRE